MGRKQRKVINVDESNPNTYPFMEGGRNFGMADFTQNMFLNHPALSQPYRMMQNFNNCRNFFQPFSTMAINPYFSYATEAQYPLNYPFYYTPYQPCLNLEVFQQQFWKDSDLIQFSILKLPYSVWFDVRL